MFKGEGTLAPCHECHTCRATRNEQPRVARRQPERANQHTTVDSSGPYRVQGSRGERYFLNWMCKMFNYPTTDCPRVKSQFLQLLKNYSARCDRENSPIELLSMDPGSEGKSGPVLEFTTEAGIQLEFGSPGCHESIGGIENYNDRQLKCSKCWMHRGNASATFLYWSGRHFTTVTRILPASSQPGSSPMERKKKFIDPSILSAVRIPYTLGWMLLNPDVHRDKQAAPNAVPVILLAMSDTMKDGWHVLVISTRRLAESSNIKSDETIFPFADKTVWKSLGLDLGVPMEVSLDPNTRGEDEDGPASSLRPEA